MKRWVSLETKFGIIPIMMLSGAISFMIREQSHQIDKNQPNFISLVIMQIVIYYSLELASYLVFKFNDSIQSLTTNN